MFKHKPPQGLNHVSQTMKTTITNYVLNKDSFTQYLSQLRDPLNIYFENTKEILKVHRR